MRRLFVGIAVAPLLLAAPVSADDEPIVGGTATTAGEFPNVVVIEVGDGLCTGTLITKDWVLTAAHCVTPSVVGESDQAALTASIKVHFGTINLGTSQGTTVKAQNSLPDPGFNINNLGQFDSGLINLASSVTDVTPVKLNFVAANAPVGIMVTQVGYGATQTGNPPGGSVGIEFQVPQTSVSCAADIGSNSNLLCFDQSDGKGKCEGDSGGPSFAMIAGKQVEVGITSFGDGSCTLFGADTRTDAEKSFLTAHVPGLECMTDADCGSGYECFNQDCIVTPFQPMGLGSTCTTNSSCDSNQCAMGGDGSKCTMQCTGGMANTCPSGFDCISAGAEDVCWPSATSSGCCDASGAGAPTAILGFALVGLVLRRRRRR
ncbi:MAG TPA: S1 family peptidase [Kofleriaceae bacterium]|nr:S1 family peptidase [Kofleriaceae bacterium]